jgi:hypothetical protein
MDAFDASFDLITHCSLVKLIHMWPAGYCIGPALCEAGTDLTLRNSTLTRDQG